MRLKLAPLLTRLARQDPGSWAILISAMCSRALWAALLALSLAHWPNIAHAQSAPTSSAESLVRAYVTAWNAGDSVRVASLFAPDAEVSQRAPWIEDAGDRAFIRDSYGAELSIHFSALTFRGAEILWARGRNDVALWAAGHFRDGHQLHIDNIRAAPDGLLTWSYQASTHAQRRVPGVSPTSGRAEATLSGGALRSLTFESDIASVQERIRRIFDAAGYIPLASTSSPPPPAPNPPQIRIGPDDGDAHRIVTGSAVAFIILTLFAARQSLRARRRPH